jgi:two-component system, OmpR family, phosphate regulon response regulator PhoB
VGQDIKTVAVCTASPALTAILSAVLAGKVGLRVRQFESKAGLTTYMQLAPVALLVCDIEDAAMVARLRKDSTLADRDLEVIALTRTLTRHERQEAVASGIDEVILKPMSPAYLLERVMNRLERRAERIAIAEGTYSGTNRRRGLSTPVATYRRVSDNVVQLFPHSWQPNP